MSATQIEDLVNNTDFAACAVGKLIQIGKHLGEVSALSRDGSELTMRNAHTGAEQTFMVNVLRTKGRASLYSSSESMPQKSPALRWQPAIE